MRTFNYGDACQQKSRVLSWLFDIPTDYAGQLDNSTEPSQALRGEFADFDPGNHVLAPDAHIEARRQGHEWLVVSGAKPVSYTHLDVYKRKVQEFVAVNPRDGSTKATVYIRKRRGVNYVSPSCLLSHASIVVLQPRQVFRLFCPDAFLPRLLCAAGTSLRITEQAKTSDSTSALTAERTGRTAFSAANCGQCIAAGS